MVDNDAFAKISVVFFDLGDTLGTATVAGSPPRLTNFDLFPFVLPSPSGPGVLDGLRQRGMRIGVISNTDTEGGAAVNAVLQRTGLLGSIDPDLLVYSGDEGITKAFPEIFCRAATRAGAVAPEFCLFVGEDKTERAVAAAAGWATCPHPLLVFEVLDGQPLQYVRLSIPTGHLHAPWKSELRRRAFVPQHLVGAHGSSVYGLTSSRVALELMHMQFGVELLGEPGLPLTTDLYLLQDDVARVSGFLSGKGEAARVFGVPNRRHLLLASPAEGFVVALPPDIGPDDIHFESARHGHTLRLTPDPLLLDDPQAAALAGFAPGAPELPLEVIQTFSSIGAQTIQDAVDRYSGVRPLNGSLGGARIVSRHVMDQARGNQMAVGQLVTDLESAGQGLLRVQLQSFTLSGQSLHNVEAELAGSSPELVLVTAHLDSTAGFDEHFDPANGAAPGADDDASGVAAVLAIASRMVALAVTSGPPARTMRFVLFNAEEQGLVGSSAYARRSKARGEVIVAVWQMDMIGYNARLPQDWEVHAGFAGSAAVEARSRRLAELILAIAPRVSPSLPAPKIHHGGSLGGDPAAGRSDHASFHAHGYPACAVSEDFFIDAPGAPEPDANPHYHRSSDRQIDAEYAAALARAVAAASWLTAATPLTAFAPTPPREFQKEIAMPTSREFDSRKRPSIFGGLPPAVASLAAAPSAARRNTLTGSPSVVRAAASEMVDGSFVERALAFVKGPVSTGFGAAAGTRSEFVVDPVVQRTSAGGAAVHLTQTYRGLTIFQMSRTVRFDSAGRTVDAAGDTAVIPDDVSTDPKLGAEAAVLKAAGHLAATGRNETLHDAFGNTHPVPTIELGDFQPTVVSGFPLPSKPTVFDKGPFENLIPAYLLMFNGPEGARLAWHIVFTFLEYADQYVVLVAADNEDGELLYCKSTLHRAMARGNVYEFSPGIADRRLIDFPRPLSDYPAMPASPIVGFPAHWIDVDQTLGNATRATLNTGTQSLKGVLSGGVVQFDPAKADGDDQKLLNIFYFCNYMHDFLYILGFDERSGNFQQKNFTNAGAGGDPVRARAHSGPVNGTANMATAPDGLPPLMNMGLVSGVGRHTAFDADVVFHEYVHGLTNRVVGGPMNANALDKLQSGGMGEGWSDYFALTVQSYYLDKEKIVSGDWVVNRGEGIRREPYDDKYRYKYGDLAASPEVHDIGEVWCAALMMMSRKFIVALGDKLQGYRLAWTIVVDGLKITPANPTFLDARDAILMALEDLAKAHRIAPQVLMVSRRAAWEAFAHFGMGANASSGDADDVDSIVPDNSLPAGV